MTGPETLREMNIVTDESCTMLGRGGPGPETLKLCGIIVKESRGVSEDTKRNLPKDSDDSVIEDSDFESEIKRPPDIAKDPQMSVAMLGATGKADETLNSDY